MTSANILLLLTTTFDKYSEEELYAILGHPKTDRIVRYSGQPPGPSAPNYVVEALDISRLDPHWIKGFICIIDFDQSFPSLDPPQKMLGTPSKCLAPEAVFDLRAGPASDIWALGCTIFKMRAGYHLFEEWGDGSPCGAIANIVTRIGNLPECWKDRRFDDDGVPIQDSDSLAGEPLNDNQTLACPLKDAIFSIVDELRTDDFNSLGIFWRPPKGSSPFMDRNEGIENLSTIPQDEAQLLYDLLAKIFVYDPAQRLSAEQLLTHRWLHL
jgi:serine/threonine-protein kinase SRPK3